MRVLHLYRAPGLDEVQRSALVRRIQQLLPEVSDIATESCFNIATSDGKPLSGNSAARLRWLLAETYDSDGLREQSIFADSEKTVIEVGPRMNFSSAFSTNAVSICTNCGLSTISRVELSRRFLITTQDGGPLSAASAAAFASAVHDRMTQQVYPEPLASFDTGMSPAPVQTVPIMTEGRAALERINQELGLAFDDWDLDFYTALFRDSVGRDPSDVECFDMAQSNSEHSRHWFFGAKMVLDGVEQPQTLFQMVKDTLRLPQPARQAAGADNSVIAFHDNSSVIAGFPISSLQPLSQDGPGPCAARGLTFHPLLTAETHNFPSGVAPFPGAETGTGGRIRDVQATGIGAHVGVGISSYCVGNLRIPGYDLPWEDDAAPYPAHLASPLQIVVEASNGASEYGNKFGEPVVTGFARSFGQRLPCGSRREWVKPIMFSAGIGRLDARHAVKGKPAPGMIVVKIGGPAYRIGMGGGAASSRVQDAASAELDFNAVQRGDAEMESKMNRVVRACVALGDRNPIVSIHDQGAGGNGNVLKEIVEPEGAVIEVRKVLVGDATLSVLEIWGAEYQENNALLLRPEDAPLFEAICAREKAPFAFLGQVTGDGRIVLHDELDDSTPVDLSLAHVLADMPQKTFQLTTVPAVTQPLQLPQGTNVASALDRVLRLLSVGSKRFLTTKVDRSVSGLVAQQQCVGPLHIPLADVSVMALGMFPPQAGTPGASTGANSVPPPQLAATAPAAAGGSEGSGNTSTAEGSLTVEGVVPGVASAVGEQPIKGLVDPAAMARCTVGEALTNLVWAKVTALEDVKCSGNWMWAAKLHGEGATMFRAVRAMRDVMLTLGVSVDGGKDSLSMAVRVGEETVKAPGALVVSTYVACPDVSLTVTPDLQFPGSAEPGATDGGRIFYIDLGGGQARLGGSALAQVYGQVGSVVPDLEEPAALAAAFRAVQQLIGEKVLCAGHDRSDGGALVALLEMAFAGNCGVEVDFPLPASLATAASEGEGKAEGGEDNGVSTAIAALFSEELGLLLQAVPGKEGRVAEVLAAAGVAATDIGRAVSGDAVTVRVGGQLVLGGGEGEGSSMRALRDVWEATGFQLDRRQANPSCVAQEEASLRDSVAPQYTLSFTPEPTSPALLEADESSKPCVAVLREEGTNGDRELQAAFAAAGFQVWDVTVSDLVTGRVTLTQFRGLAFPGGFSYADVLDSAKGWAGVLRCNASVWAQFEAFYARPDTFSLGVCNGCQLMALLGWVPGGLAGEEKEAAEEEEKAAAAAAAAAEGEGKGEEGEDSPPPPHLWSGQPRFVRNHSGRYESRFPTVKVLPSPAIMLQGMEGSSLGVWVAHGEGRAFFPHDATLQRVLDSGCAPLRYVDSSNEATEAYPANPNGSPLGITALCSPDGRHLAMMPHPERVFTNWQWPWQPQEWRDTLRSSPWLRLFQNARQWCDDNPAPAAAAAAE